MNYVWAFTVGGLICVAGQILIDLTKLTPARILVSFVVSGVVLSALGLWQPVLDVAGAGALVPMIGFGHTLAQGMQEAIAKEGLIGIFTGGFSACAGGVAASLIFGFIAAVFAKPNSQS
ncbi:MAG: stage V sporulation protein AE [Oscillospiraceae bacterium]|nr:stage V sporulation protein AE [Oscillospiraceae bacterium]